MKQNFIHEFFSSPILQWRRQNLSSKGHSAKMYSPKTLKNFEKFIKQFAQKFKKSQNFFQKKIKFNRF